MSDVGTCQQMFKLADLFQLETSSPSNLFDGLLRWSSAIVVGLVNFLMVNFLMRIEVPQACRHGLIVLFWTKATVHELCDLYNSLTTTPLQPRFPPAYSHNEPATHPATFSSLTPAAVSSAG